MKEQIKNKQLYRANTIYSGLQLMMLTLSARPNIEKQFEQTIAMIDNISNTVSSLRNIMVSLNSQTKKNQQYMFDLLPNNSKKTDTTNNHIHSEFSESSYDNQNKSDLPVEEDDANNQSKTNLNDC